MEPSVARTLVDVVRISAQHAQAAQTWREIAIASIHRLADQHQEMRRLQARHERLIADHRALRQVQMEQAA